MTILSAITSLSPMSGSSKSRVSAGKGASSSMASNKIQCGSCDGGYSYYYYYTTPVTYTYTYDYTIDGGASSGSSGSGSSNGSGSGSGSCGCN